MKAGDEEITNLLMAEWLGVPCAAMKVTPLLASDTGVSIPEQILDEGRITRCEATTDGL